MPRRIVIRTVRRKFADFIPSPSDLFFPKMMHGRAEKGEGENTSAEPMQTRFFDIVRYPGLLALIAGGLVLASCGGGLQDPHEFYGQLVEAARKHDGGFMYDVLDSARKAEVDTLIGMQLANVDKLPPFERPRWDSLKGKSKREIYSRILGTDEGVAALFRGDYKITRVDTFVVVTVQHSGQPQNVMYLRPRDGKYVVSQAPRREADLQQQPPMPPDSSAGSAKGQSAPAPGGRESAPGKAPAAPKRP